jgi:4-hydroxythreonine-4-phosphate dehydrogenase
MEASLMLMMSEGLRVGVVSGHVPLRKVPSDISKERIVQKLGILERSLKEDLLIERPLIAVLGLNPHAGESGMLGSEEEEIILPAIEEFRNERSSYCFGPFPADGFFGSEELGKYDAVLAMYHDQGLVPFKALSFGRGVNFTAGLPIVRTSPDHGTAFGIAGQGKASPNSLRNALYTAIDLQRNRLAHKAMTADPLRPQKGSPYMKGGKG